MYEYTCPGCRTKATAPSVENNKVLACRACGRKLRVVINEEDDDESPVSAPRAAASGSWMSPWLVAAGGVPGLLGAVLIVALWFLFGRGAASAGSTEPPAVVQAGPAVSQPSRVAPVETGKDAGPHSTEPKKGGGDKKGDAIELAELAAPAAMSDEKIYELLLKSCVWVVAGDGTPEGTHHGSGAVIDLAERLVVTNEHVANPTSTRIAVLFPMKSADGKLVTENKAYLDELSKGNGIPAKVVRVDKRRDLTLIQLDRLPATWTPAAIRVGTKPPSPGQKVQTIGANPKNNPWQWVRSDGPVRQVSFSRWQYEDGYPREAELIASQVPINGGDSGGPLVDGRCVLVGVNNGGAPGQLNSMHISVTEVRDFITGYFRDARKEWKEPAKPAEAIAGADLRKLMKALDSSDGTVRSRAAQLLAGLGFAAREAVPALLKALRAADPAGDEVKDLEAALSEIGPPNKEALNDLLAALRDKQCAPARRYAADALGKLGDGVKGAAGPLVTALKDDDKTVRRNAASSLGRLGPAASDEAFDSLFALLRDKDADVRQAAKGALMLMGKPPTDVASLRAQAADTSASKEAREYSVLALQKFPGEAVPVLLEILNTEKDPDLAGDAAFVLGLLKVHTKEVGDALARALDPSKPVAVRVSAVHAIRSIGLDQQTLPAFMKALDSSEEGIRSAALGVMTNISTFIKGLPSLTLTKDAVAVLVPGLASAQPYARWFAAYGLSTLKAEAAPAVPALREALAKEQSRDPRMSPIIHLEILAAVAEIGPDAMTVLGKDAADKFLDELKDFANDTDDFAWQRRTCAALALGRIAPDRPQARGTLPVLVKALRLPNFNKPDRNPIDDELHERAAKALIKAGKFAALPLAQVCAAHFAWRLDDPVQTRLEKGYACRKTFEVLERIGPDAACPAVYQLLRGASANPSESAPNRDAAASAYYAIYKKK